MIKVILLESVKNLGLLGNVVNVKPGFARNFLLPQQKAIVANNANLAKFESQKAILEQEEMQRIEAANSLASAFNELKLAMKALGSEDGKLYGSISGQDIAGLLAEQHSINITRKQVVFAKGLIKTIGEYEVEIHLHPSVVIKLPVQVELH